MPLPANFFRVPMIVINGLSRFVEVKMVTPALIDMLYLRTARVFRVGGEGFLSGLRFTNFHIVLRLCFLRCSIE